nr:hypothetical protein [Cuspidothrix issatschenkoi]
MASCPAESTVVDFFRPLLLRLTSGRQALSPVPEVKPSASLRLKTCSRSIRSPSSGEVYRCIDISVMFSLALFTSPKSYI